MEPAQLLRRARQFPSLRSTELHFVIRHQTGPALQQSHHRLAFPHSALAFDEHADAFHVHHAAVLARLRREFPFQPQGAGVDEPDGVQRGTIDIYTSGVGHLHQMRRQVPAATGDNHRNLAVAERVECRLLLAFAQICQVGELGVPQHLHALVGEVEVESRECQAGPVDGRLENLPRRSRVLAFQFKVQMPAVTRHEVPHRQTFDLAGF
jgi:hypothetical protein